MMIIWICSVVFFVFPWVSKAWCFIYIGDINDYMMITWVCSVVFLVSQGMLGLVHKICNYDLSRRHDVIPKLTRQNFEIDGICNVYMEYLTLPVPDPACSQNVHGWQRAVWGATGWEGRDEKDVGKRVESAWGCWKGSEENHMHTTMCFLGMVFWLRILFYLGRARCKTAPSLGTKKTRRSYALKIGTGPCCAGPCRCQKQG